MNTAEPKIPQFCGFVQVCTKILVKNQKSYRFLIDSVKNINIMGVVISSLKFIQARCEYQAEWLEVLIARNNNENLLQRVNASEPGRSPVFHYGEGDEP
jgi:hypothetical protein